MPVVLYWGRADLPYSRNSILLRLMRDLGWSVDFFRPVSSATGSLEAWFRRFRQPDLIWVPCFRHDDISSAAVWKKNLKVPLIVDPLISAWEKESIERGKWPTNSGKAEKRRAWEIELYRKADRVIIDTPAHANFFMRELEVPADKISVLYLGAETDRYTPALAQAPEPPFEILFYGSYLPLQGADVVVKAARLTQDLPVIWVMVGEGEQKKHVRRLAEGLTNVRFEPWIENGRLNARISKAHILLGIFGETLKADVVIPNKVFQAMAAGRPVITRKSLAFQGTLEGADAIGWVDAGNPESLAATVRDWLRDPGRLASRGMASRRLFEEHFGMDSLKSMLNKVLEQTLGSQSS
jgi:glycosyltransferase involved in cell wall biosynthesis